MISLVGMPGCGKSTVGRHLARKLGWRFVDADAEVELRLGESIRAHFERCGEASFRDTEAIVLSDLAHAGATTILATGGGAVLRAENRRVLKAAGPVVYLRATAQDLFKRLRNDRQRPLLQGVDPQQKLRSLFAERDPLYSELADFTIDTGRSSVPALVQMLASQLELAGLVTPPGATS